MAIQVIKGRIYVETEYQGANVSCVVTQEGLVQLAGEFFRLGWGSHWIAQQLIVPAEPAEAVYLGTRPVAGCRVEFESRITAKSGVRGLEATSLDARGHLLLENLDHLGRVRITHRLDRSRGTVFRY